MSKITNPTPVFWVKLKGEPAVDPTRIVAVDIITEPLTNDFCFNIIIADCHHFCISRPSLAKAQRARNSVLRQVAFFRSK